MMSLVFQVYSHHPVVMSSPIFRDPALIPAASLLDKALMVARLDSTLVNEFLTPIIISGPTTRALVGKLVIAFIRNALHMMGLSPFVIV